MLSSNIFLIRWNVKETGRGVNRTLSRGGGILSPPPPLELFVEYIYVPFLVALSRGVTLLTAPPPRPPEHPSDANC